MLSHSTFTSWSYEKYLKAKLACHPARCLLPVEIIERFGLTTGPATVELLSYLLPYGLDKFQCY